MVELACILYTTKNVLIILRIKSFNIITNLFLNNAWKFLQAEAHPTDEGEGPGPQDGRHPAGAAGQSAQGHHLYLSLSLSQY